MAYTKRQLIEQAFTEIGLAAYTFDLQPEQYETALRQLDAMMAAWNGKGIKLGYPLSLNPQNSNIDDDTFVPLEASEAVYLNLAIRIAQSFGRVVMPELKSNAKMAYDVVVQLAAFPREMQFPGTTPAGAGNKTWRQYKDPYLRHPDEDPLAVDPNGQLDFVGD